MGTPAPKTSRPKLSTTVSHETHEFLEQMIARGDAATVAEALDIIVGRMRQLDNRQRLAEATAKYFAQADSRAAREESELAKDMASAASTIDFDTEI